MPATKLPTSIDRIVSDGAWVPLWSGSRTVAHAIIDDDGDGQGIAGELVVRGLATFRGALEVSLSITGNAVFDEAAYLVGSVSGAATFIGNACNAGGTAGTFVPNPPPAC